MELTIKQPTEGEWASTEEYYNLAKNALREYEEERKICIKHLRSDNALTKEFIDKMEETKIVIANFLYRYKKIDDTSAIQSLANTYTVEGAVNKINDWSWLARECMCFFHDVRVVNRNYRRLGQKEDMNSGPKELAILSARNNSWIEIERELVTPYSATLKNAIGKNEEKICNNIREVLAFGDTLGVRTKDISALVDKATHVIYTKKSKEPNQVK